MGLRLFMMPAVVVTVSAQLNAYLFKLKVFLLCIFACNIPNKYLLQHFGKGLLSNDYNLFIYLVFLGTLFVVTSQLCFN